MLCRSCHDKTHEILNSGSFSDVEEFRQKWKQVRALVKQSSCGTDPTPNLQRVKLIKERLNKLGVSLHPKYITCFARVFYNAPDSDLMKLARKITEHERGRFGSVGNNDVCELAQSIRSSAK